MTPSFVFVPVCGAPAAEAKGTEAAPSPASPTKLRLRKDLLPIPFVASFIRVLLAFVLDSYYGIF
jgi:hypothetical protein